MPVLAAGLAQRVRVLEQSTCEKRQNTLASFAVSTYDLRMAYLYEEEKKKIEAEARRKIEVVKAGFDQRLSTERSKHAKARAALREELSIQREKTRIALEKKARAEAAVLRSEIGRAHV